MPTPTVPILYKYLPRKRLDVLVSGLIRFSPVADLNDPFESRPLVTANRQSAVRRARQEGHDDRTVAEMVKSFSAYVEQHGTQVLWDSVNEEFGILSLTATATQPVMWGQYADSYRGYVIGFDASHPWLAPNPSGSDVTDRPRAVVYQLERPRVTIAASEDYDAEQFVVGSVLTKNEAWSFEQEFRVVKDVRGAIAPVEPAAVTNLFAVPPDAVHEVIVGPRMADEDRKRIVDVISSGRYPQAQLKQLIIDEATYALRVTPR